MAVEIAGFGQALASCLAFEGVETNELEDVLASGAGPLEMLFVDPSADVPFIQSGSSFTHLFFVQQGTVITWQYPHSELSSPFLIGDHEFMMDAERWVGSYSAAIKTTVVGIPVGTMRLVVERIPRIQAQMRIVLMRRMARYYWISLATSGSPASRVAAALVSRLALDGEDHGHEREIKVRQQDIVRLTVLSRSAVASGISSLVSANIIRVGDDNRGRFTGVVHVPEVDQLKNHAFSEVREKEIRPLLRQNED